MIEVMGGNYYNKKHNFNNDDPCSYKDFDN